MKRFLVASLMVVSLVWGPNIASAREVYVGVVTGGASPMFEAMLTELRQELDALSGPDLRLSIPESKVRHGGWRASGVSGAFTAMEADTDVGLGIALGYVASAVAARQDTWKRPILASHLLVPSQKRAQGFRSVDVGAVLQAGVGRFLKEVGPSSVTLLVDARAAAILPEVHRFGVLFLQEKSGIRFRVVTAEADALSMVAAVDSDAESVIVGPFPTLAPQSMELVAEALAKRKLPSYAMGGRRDVEAGLLFTAESEGLSQRLSRRMALILYSMAREEKGFGGAQDPGDVVTPVVNLATARAVGFSPGWELLRYAETVGGSSEPGTRLSLSAAIAMAQKQNPEMVAQEEALKASAQDVSRAFSYLAPRITADVMGVRIDENSAEKSMGRESETSVKGSLTLKQVLYSERALAGYSAIKKIQASREWELAAKRLDLSLSVAQAYIRLLKAKSLAEVQAGNLALTEENLARARARKRAGALNPSELFRWESEVASGRTELLKARSMVQFAENALKRVCGMSLSKNLNVGVAGTEDVLLSSRPGFEAFLETPADFKALIPALVHEGINASPELAGLSDAVASGRRRIKGAQRVFYLPEVALQGKVTEVFDRGGYDKVLPPFEEREWQVGIQVSLPLVTGGERLADLRKATRETASMASQKRHIRATLEERIVDGAISVQVSKASIELAEMSRHAAEKNLALVKDAYSQGAVPVITLLDAQNTAVKARIAAKNAVYDHMLDQVLLQRLLGAVDLSGGQGEALLVRLEQTMERGMAR